LAQAAKPENTFYGTAALVFTLLLPALLQFLAILTWASSGVVALVPYLSRNFREVREEAFWFEWER